MTLKNNNLNEIGTILYEKINDDCLNIIEINSAFNLRKAKIKHKNWTQSKIFSLKDNFIYIEQLDKWYYNNDLFKNEDIHVDLYDSIDDIKVNPEEKTNEEEEALPNNLVFSGYLLYNNINYNHISCKEFKSRLVLENELDNERKRHISKIYKKECFEKVYYIQGLNKWYYNSKNNYSNFINVRLYDSFEEIPYPEIIKKEEKEPHYNNIDENVIFRRGDFKRLNLNVIHKDLSKLGYMLFEFTSINHIKYKVFDKYEEAEEFFEYNNQITKCYKKRNDENIIYIKALDAWISKTEKIAKLYETDIDIPQEIEKEQNYIKTENKIKSIFKLRNLVPGAWIYYEKVGKNEILARQYNSSNQLLSRLTSGGNDSRYYKSKNKKVYYIEKLDKWYYENKKLENEDQIIKIFDEKEIFGE